MYWTLNFSIRTKRREWRLEPAILKRPFGGSELFADGSRRVDLGPLELSIDPRRDRR